MVIAFGSLRLKKTADDLADTLESTLHRVTLPPLADRFEGKERVTKERYSVVYFVGADPDAVVNCLPTCIDAQNPPKYEPITQREYCEMRSRVQYRTAKPPEKGR